MVRFLWERPRAVEVLVGQTVSLRGDRLWTASAAR